MPSSDAYSLFRAIGEQSGGVLESMEGIPRRAVRSILCVKPPLCLTLDGEITVEGSKNLQDIISIPEMGNPITQLRSFIKQFEWMGPSSTGFLGGLVGFCSYDMVRELSEGMVPAGKEGPLARFMLCTQGIVFDHARDSCILFDDLILNGETDCRKEHARARQRLEKLEEKIRRISAERTTDRAHIPRASSPPVSSVSREAYQEAVRKALEYIHAGDIFQVVLSRKITCHVREDPLDIYGAIRTINPSPYLYYLQFGDEAIIGSSPEMLVKVEGKSVQTVPIAGTRPRGNSVAEDTKLAAELLADPKERAEHLMLVDLARNDIGKISDFGSVNVPEYMEVEKFSHVQHIVSRVCGTLREDRDRFDAFASCFPAGTVSGAPKIRAMQIIAELETQPRGLYAGAVGYAGFSNDLEFAIAIRTLRFRRGFVEFSTGAGIVADSIPEREFEETEYKAGAMMKAIGIVGVTG
ncbi:MAG: anthranilate synthase component I family protein [Methanolinea sp.]